MNHKGSRARSLRREASCRLEVRPRRSEWPLVFRQQRPALRNLDRPHKRAAARQCVGGSGTISVQVLNKIAHVGRRKMELDWRDRCHPGDKRSRRPPRRALRVRHLRRHDRCRRAGRRLRYVVVGGYARRPCRRRATDNPKSLRRLSIAARSQHFPTRNEYVTRWTRRVFGIGAERSSRRVSVRGYGQPDVASQWCSFSVALRLQRCFERSILG